MRQPLRAREPNTRSHPFAVLTLSGPPFPIGGDYAVHLAGIRWLFIKFGVDYAQLDSAVHKAGALVRVLLTSFDRVKLEMVRWTTLKDDSEENYRAKGALEWVRASGGRPWTEMAMITMRGVTTPVFAALDCIQGIGRGVLLLLLALAADLVARQITGGDEETPLFYTRPQIFAQVLARLVWAQQDGCLLCNGTVVENGDYVRVIV